MVLDRHENFLNINNQSITYWPYYWQIFCLQRIVRCTYKKSLFSNSSEIEDRKKLNFLKWNVSFPVQFTFCSNVSSVLTDLHMYVMMKKPRILKHLIWLAYIRLHNLYVCKMKSICNCAKLQRERGWWSMTYYIVLSCS